jgi:hypothetical protein
MTTRITIQKAHPNLEDLYHFNFSSCSIFNFTYLLIYVFLAMEVSVRNIKRASTSFAWAI